VNELVEPVEDAKGFVYEKAPLLKYLKSKGGRCRSPIAETNHMISVKELRPAKHILASQHTA